MKIIGVIPARGGSSRFFEKPLALIAGKPMLFWVYKHCKEVSVFDDVFVATDSEKNSIGCIRVWCKSGDDFFIS